MRKGYTLPSPPPPYPQRSSVHSPVARRIYGTTFSTTPITRSFSLPYQSFHFDCLFRRSCSRPAFCRLGYIRHRVKRAVSRLRDYVGIVKLCKLSKKKLLEFQNKKGELPPPPSSADLPSGDRLARTFHTYRVCDLSSERCLSLGIEY